MKVAHLLAIIIVIILTCQTKFFRKKFTMKCLCSIKNSKENTLDRDSLVSLSTHPHDITLGVSPWTVSWITNPTNIAGNSWVGVYPFAQLSTSANLISYFNIQGRLEGSEQLPTPSEAGIYEIRYIQDNNLKSVSSIGPYYVNPGNISIRLSKTESIPEEKIILTLIFNDNARKELQERSAKLYLCLNFIGDYERCLWKEDVGYSENAIHVTLPSSAGYYVVRLIEDLTEENSFKKINVICVSKIIKISHEDYNVIPKECRSVIASSLSATWKVKNGKNNDWIGLFSLSEVGLFDRKYPPAKKKYTNGENSGVMKALIPAENQAGPYIFIYFKEHLPIAVSSIVNVQQPKVKCPAERKTMTKIQHLVIICTENHSFDSYFGNYCTGEIGKVKCNQGPRCCEKAPITIDEGVKPFVLDDKQNLEFDPNHNEDCELCEINSGKMDRFVRGCYCSNPQNFAIANEKTYNKFFDITDSYALADRYFQPNAGASAQNNMYLARGSYVFKDNAKIAVGSIGSNCHYLQRGIPDEYAQYYNPIITSLLAKCGFTLRTYAEGYEKAARNFVGNKCYPHGYDSSDIPYNYYAGITDRPKFITDYGYLKRDISEGILPDVSFVKPLGIKTGHPGIGSITDEVNFIKETVDSVMNSPYKDKTLIIWVPDESGGYYDHVAPPQTNEVDGVPYGARVPMMAFGEFVKKNYISHVTMEHSSILKFIEWNWLSGETGQLNTRDRNVNGIGDMIDSEKAGNLVP